MEISEMLELQGNVVLMPIYNPSRPNKDAFTNEMHRERIKLSDAILVINVNGYIGKSTKSEIEFAKSLNREVIYYTDLINAI